RRARGRLAAGCCGRRSRWSGTRLPRVLLSLLESNVEGVAQGVAEKVEAEDHEQDQQAGHVDGVGGDGDVLATLGEHRAPFGSRRLSTEAKETETGRLED